MASAGGTPDIVFRGTDGNECEEFIAAIEELAFTEGWPEDKKRMLLFARSRLRQKALRWFARLDPSKKGDWDLFVEALFDQYPPVELPPEIEIATPVWSTTTFSPSASTATLPPNQYLDTPPNTMADDRQLTTVNQSRHTNVRTYDPSVSGRQLGRLRIVVEDGTAGPQYVWRGQRPTSERTDGCPFHGLPYDQLGTTIDRQEALVVCFISSPEPHPIGCLNSVYSRRLRNLSVWYTPLSAHSYGLWVADGVVTINDEGTGTSTGGLHVSQVWNVLSDGSLQASLCALDSTSLDRGTGKYARKEYFKTTEVHLDISGASVYFVKPGTPLQQDDPKRNTQPSNCEIKARLVFEPL